MASSWDCRKATCVAGEVPTGAPPGPVAAAATAPPEGAMPSDCTESGKARERGPPVERSALDAPPTLAAAVAYDGAELADGPRLVALCIACMRRIGGHTMTAVP